MKNNFLKIVLVLVIIILASLLCSCQVPGKISECKVVPIESEVYTQDDYEDACQVIFRYFKINFFGCNMTEIKYAGDDNFDGMKEWAEEYGVDEVIILESTFDTDSIGGDSSLNPNDTYTDWQWILARNKGGRWHHKDHGYG